MTSYGIFEFRLNSAPRHPRLILYEKSRAATGPQPPPISMEKTTHVPNDSIKLCCAMKLETMKDENNPYLILKISRPTAQ